MTEKYRPIYERQAKENKQSAIEKARKYNGNNINEQFSQNSSTTVSNNEKIDVRAKLARIAGVSTDTYSKGKKILDSDNEEIKQRVLSGETSISTGYKELQNESNIRRRGEIGGSAKKVGKRIKELERLYGIHQGNGSNQHEQKPNNSVIAKSQSDLAAQMGISVDTLQNYKILADLIETNIRQRGIGNPNAIKLGRCIKELERIYDIKQGGSGFYGNRHTKDNLESSNNYKTLKTEADIAKELGISVQSLQNYKKLTEMIPELENLVETGILAPTTALVFV